MNEANSEHKNCKFCGADNILYEIFHGDIVWKCSKCFREVMVRGQWADNGVLDGIRILWFIASTAAFFQRDIFPNWLTPDCPRIRIVDGFSGNWALLYMPEPPDPFNRNYEISESVRFYEIDIHIEIHRFGFDVAGTHIDGLYDIGVGFVYLGPPDPDRYNQEERRGFGNMYCWFKKLEPPEGTISVLPTYGRQEVEYDR